MKKKSNLELYFNNDSTDFFDVKFNLPSLEPEKLVSKESIEAVIEDYVDVIIDAGVTVFLQNTNARKTNYSSNVWQSFWDDSDSWPLPGKCQVIHDLDVDYPATVVKRCRERKISPWISLRMNDCHCNDRPDHGFHGDFWKLNPQYAVKGFNDYFATCLDFAHQEVRDYFMALVEETLTRYDIDGLELDFMREPYLFSKGKEQSDAPILTQWLREVYKLVKKYAKQRGHDIRLGVRLPSRPVVALALGFDFITWNKEELLDLLTPTPRWGTLDHDIPLMEWREMLGKSKLTLLGGLEGGYRPYLDADLISVKHCPDVAWGAACKRLADGADAIYLYNYFRDETPVMEALAYKEMLQSMTSLDTLLSLPRRVGITYSDITAPGENYQAQLPKSGSYFEFYLNPGPTDTANCSLLLDAGDCNNIPQVFVNGGRCDFLKRDPESDLLEFKIPESVVKSNCINKIVLLCPSFETLEIKAVEMMLTPKA